MKKYISLIILIACFIFFYGLTIKGVAGNPFIYSDFPTINDNHKIIAENHTEKGGPFESSQQSERFSLIQAIVEHKSLILDKYAEFSVPDIGFYNGHYFSAFPPGLSIIAIPAYIIGKYLGYSQLAVFLLPAIFNLFTAIFILLILKNIFKINQIASFIASFIYLFASIAWPYGTTFFAHSLSAFLITSSYYFIIKNRRIKFTSILLFSLLFGIAIVTDYPNMVTMIPMFLYVVYLIIQLLRENRRIILNKGYLKLFAFIPLLLIIFLYSIYNYKLLNNPIATVNSYVVTTLVSNSYGVPQYPENQRLTFGNFNNGFFILFLGLERGLLIFSPVFLLTLWGIAPFYNKYKKESILLLLTVCTNILVYSTFADPWGGWSFGPRYLISITPLLSILVAFYLNTAKADIKKILVSYSLTIFSIGVALLGTLTSNNIPPAKESSATGFWVSYIYNLPILLNNQTKTFFYTNYLSKNISSIIFYLLIFTTLTIIITISYILLFRSKKGVNLSEI